MILATDYDGTFKQNKIIKEEDLKAIQDFRKNGHKFGIVTGRSLKMIRLEIEEYKIPFDFLVCNNGALLVNNRYEILRRFDIDYDIAMDLVSYVTKDKSVKIGCSNGDDYGNIQDGCFPIEPKYSLLDKYRMDGNEILKNKIISSFFIKAKDLKHTKELYEDLISRYKNKLAFHFNRDVIDVSNPLVNKKTGVESLKKIYDEEIYTIGDGQNDICMIEGFNGFTVYTADDEVKKYATKIFSGIKETIDYLENKQ